MLETTVIGSYPQPSWLLDKALLRSEHVACVWRSVSAAAGFQARLPL